jgi:transglutaminase-like putative cysteine protease
MSRMRVRHVTTFSYDHLVSSSYNELRMTPLPTAHQRILLSQIAISPVTNIYEYDDYWGTHVHSFEVLEPHHVLSVVASSEIEMLGGSERSAEIISWDELKGLSSQWPQAEFLADTSACVAPNDLRQAARELAAAAANPHQAALDICGFVHDTVKYLPGTTNVTTTAQQAWALRAGVCQDITQICIAALRSAEIPVKYVSGYIASRQQLEVGEGAVGESHAWLEWRAADWFAFDPTNMKPANDSHFAVARGRQYSDVAPLRGVFEGHAKARLDVTVEVARLE